MSDIYFGESNEHAIAIIKGFVNRINADFYGNGRAGLMQQVLKFMGDYEAIEEERERQQKLRHEQNSEKLDELSVAISKAGLGVNKKSLWWTIAGIGVAFASLMVGVLALVLSLYLTKHADADPAKLFHSESLPVVSYSSENPPSSVR